MVRSCLVTCLGSHADSNHLRFSSRCMRRGVGALALLLSLLPVLLSTGWSQTDPSGGTLPFSTQVSGPVDSVDLATGNIQIRIPVRSKTGAIPFSFALVGNSHAYAYTIIAPNGGPKTYVMRVSSSFRGQPMNLMGASLQYAATGNNLQCGGGGPDPEYSFSVVDSSFAHHPLDVVTDANGCLPLPQGAVTTDGSGYTVNFTTPETGNIYDKAGNQGAIGTMSDPDGNQVTTSYSGNTENFNDTLVPTGTPYAVSATESYPGGPNPDTYRYTDGSGNTQTVQVNYSTYAQRTNFNCSPYLDINTPSAYLPSSINVPGGETTPSPTKQLRAIVGT